MNELIGQEKQFSKTEAAGLIHNELAVKVVTIARENPNTAIKDLSEYDEIKRIWETMDVLRKYYLEKEE